MAFTINHLRKWVLGHRNRVYTKMYDLGNDLTMRGRRHDNSYTDSVEAELFIKKNTATTKEGREHYGKLLAEIHSRSNDYYPAFFNQGIKEMNMIQLIEFICDKMASYEETVDNVKMEISVEDYYQFVITDIADVSDDLKAVIRNTIEYISDRNVVIKRIIEQKGQHYGKDEEKPDI